MKDPRRATRQRRLILDEVVASREHPTADEVFRKVRARMPRISLATVYRNLHVLVGEGRIRKVRGNGRQMRFDGDHRDHLHIVCERCGRISDVHGEDGYSDICRLTAEKAGYELVSADVRLTGVCPECRGGGSG